MNELTVTEPKWTDAQIEMIRNTYAKGASQQEFEIFLYKCRHLDLDPMKNQIYFVKYGSNPGTVIVGLEGFRARAAKTGKHSGTERGVLRDAQGKITHGFCKVYRSDWQYPAYEESPMAEYNSNRGNWSKMPETMIKKIAEVAALRMAFPDELSGLEAQEDTRATSEPEQIKRSQIHEAADKHVEMIKSDLAAYDAKFAAEKDEKAKALVKAREDFMVPPRHKKEVLNHATGETTIAIEIPPFDSLAEYTVPFGKKHFGKTLKAMGLKEATGYRDWLKESAKKNGKAVDGSALSFCLNVDEFERRNLANGEAVDTVGRPPDNHADADPLSEIQF